jgi:cell division protein FtsI (penicillin-binding protein 3)
MAAVPRPNTRRATARGVPFSASPLLAVKLPAWRSRLVLFMMFAAFLALAGRALWLQGLSTEFLQKQGAARYARTLELPATRGKITDRNGEVLASSVPVKAVWAIPDDVLEAPADKLRALSALLEMPEAELRKKLDSDRNFVYLKRQVEQETVDRILKLQIAGIETRKEYKRFYPQGEVMAHVVGFTNVEDAGQDGMELGMQKTLAGVTGSRRVIKDRRAARRPRPGAVARQQDPVHRVFPSQGNGRQVQGQGRRRGGDRHQDRRGAGAGQPADLQPEQPLDPDRRHAAQPRDHRHLRAGFDA